MRPVTSLWHEGSQSFLKGAKLFTLCPIDLKYVQNIVLGEAKIFLGGLRHPALPWLRACIQFSLILIKSEQTFVH